MRCDELCQTAVALLKGSELGQSAKIIRSMPDVKLTVIKEQPVIALGIEKTELSPVGIGEENYVGEVVLNLNIYVPYRLKSALACALLSETLGVLAAMNIKKIAADGIFGDKQLSCYVLKTKLSFFDEYENGGDGGE